jgi:hypothetical protein
MLTSDKYCNARPNAGSLHELIDGQREVVEAGHPVFRQTADRLSQSRVKTRTAWTKYRPARAFWIGVLIGLLLVGFVFAMT